MRIARTRFARAAAAASIAGAGLWFAAGPILAQTSSFTEDGLRVEITGISTDVKKKKDSLSDLQKKADRFRELVMEKSGESATLENQIALIENGIARTQLSIDIAKQEIRGLELEMKIIDEKVAERERQMARERRLLGALSRKLYHAQFRTSLLEILMTKASFSDFFDAVQSVAELQHGVRKTLANVVEHRERLKEERALREGKQLAITEQKQKLEVAKRELEDERALKEALLIETKASELEYRYLLAELRREQNQADSEIAYLERALREKMDLADRLSGEDSVLSWPVVPARGLSTRFHDPEYPFRHIFEHPGIDIRSPQGTAVRASAAGIVARAKDAGMGYSYVMVIHNNDVSTVYGHLVRIVAREDTFVERGEVIGYSGGMPGTPGAGRMTTGPHLHFESRLRGIPVDPLRFLISL